eukprot:GHRR01025936.1.p1 GENE.GHRR01025936.1~~GHRR01025936.1.p1  ORF type:complete len:238 (+),score=92.52 GHRR01025936.1:292-1005(+)
MAPAGDTQDGWVVVGGKGRPRKTPEQQQKHLKSRAAAAAVLAAVTGRAPPAPACQQLSDGATAACHMDAAEAQQNAAAASQLSPLPGWGPSPEREWKIAQRSKSKKKHASFNLTPEQQADQLVQQTQDISQQLLKREVFRSLVAAMHKVDSHTPSVANHLKSSGSTISSDQHCDANHQHSCQCHRQLQQQIYADPQPQPTQQQQQCEQWCWSVVQQLVCYGLGSVEDSRVSRYQVGA